MNIKEEKIKVILQFLRQYKYDQTFQKLQEQSQIQLDPYSLELITQSIKNYDIKQLEQILNQYVDENTKQQCILKVLEQQYIKLLKLHNVQEAVQLLRNQMTKFCQDEDQKYQYASMIYLPELKVKQEQELIDEVMQLCYKQIGLIEPNRLVTIIQQQQAKQILDCHFHNKLEQDYKIIQKHSCNFQLNIIKQKKNISFCLFSSNGQYKALVHGLSIYLYQFDNQIKEYQKKPRKIPTGQTSVITSIVFSPCNKYLGTSSEDFTVFVYNIQTEKKYKLEGHNAVVQAFNFVLCDQQKKKQKNEYDIYTISKDGWLYEWNESERKGGLKIEEKLLNLHIHQQKELLLLTSQNKISLYQLYSKKQISQTSTIKNNQNSIVDKDFNFVLLFVSDTITQLHLYSISELLLIKVFQPTSSITTLSTQLDFGCMNSNLIAAANSSGQLLVWHIQKSSQPIEIFQVSEQQKEISCFKFHPTQNQLYVYQQKDVKRQSSQQQQVSEDIRAQFLQQRHQFQRHPWGMQQILNFLQRIARQEQMSSNQSSMQEEDKGSSDEDL
ncbi:unnamed protein product (macronuclear) [Paramecium tetraurelia]|uniref:LisH domain-containing protein n=1 Tax=Paramecium tetraurelia TaxID=5888 RepID=A0D7B1_PARTE|nr:uncharacterized protein GSPATT00001970001 [Paramecium tetraurelia]CAK78928.1 unnamed protein product [Paramecium tetraurelia]|eukprot:XP_001446325.1 hypothetical protein (macronuclear) [Paramecium tetraurelia strain d4-2]